MMPVARSAMGKKDAKALVDYQKKLDRSFDKMLPWLKSHRRRASLRGKVKPGTTVVMLEGGESADNPLFKDATVTRE